METFKVSFYSHLVVSDCGTHCCCYNHQAYHTKVIMIEIENAIVSFYNKLCDCEYNNWKEIMLALATTYIHCGG